MKQLSLEVLDGTYTVHRFPADAEVPTEVWKSSFLSVTKTTNELSIVCDASIDIDSPQKEADWGCLKVLGPLDFSLTGVLAALSTILAEAEISIFAVSTFDTDYLMVKSGTLDRAIAVLRENGYTVSR